MLENIKAAIAQKNEAMNMSELLLGNGALMESMDDSIVLTPYMEAEEPESEDPKEAEVPEADEDDGEKAEEGVKGADGEASDNDGDPMNTSLPDEGDDDDPMSMELPDEGDEGDLGDGSSEPVPAEEPLPLPGDDLPTPVSSTTGEPVNTDDDIMSMELSMGSDTPRDILPVPPANAADAIAGDGDPLMQGVDSGFGGNSMSGVGPMDGTTSVMDTPMDDPITNGAPGGEPAPAEGGDPAAAPVPTDAAPADDLSLESAEQKIKNDVNHEEQHKKKVAEEARASAKADDQFGEGYLFDMDGNPIQESSDDDDDFIFDPFSEGTVKLAKPDKKGLIDEEAAGLKGVGKKSETKTEGYDFDKQHADPMTEAIELGEDDQKPAEKKENQPEDPAAVDGGENEVTAAVKDKVDEADGGTDGAGDDLGGGLDFGGGDLAFGAPAGGGTEATTKTMQMLSKLMGDIAKMQSELAGDLAGQ